MGWICFGGNVAERHGVVHATILNSSRDRLFIAPIGLWITLDAGHIVGVDFDPRNHSVNLHLARASAYVPMARLRLTQTIDKAKGQSWAVATQATVDAGATVIPLGAGETTVSLVETHP